MICTLLAFIKDSAMYHFDKLKIKRTLVTRYASTHQYYNNGILVIPYNHKENKTAVWNLSL